MEENKIKELVKYAEDVVEHIKLRDKNREIIGTAMEIDGEYISIINASTLEDYLLAKTQHEIFLENEQILKDVKDFSKAIKGILRLKENLFKKINENTENTRESFIKIIKDEIDKIYKTNETGNEK